ncbi:hypothetical protein [uncultured Chitinophaga sp.]|uniref:hypothetical protein n=1 Tax=uncultured Chitinophaga sp. TaxID=339340 RepID=UPI0026353FEF|nr:hypothetical protein [uncultured Chitinophaga sp.]
MGPDKPCSRFTFGGIPSFQSFAYITAENSRTYTQLKLNMTRFLKLKHWQLFCLFIGIPFVFQFVMTSALVSGGDPADILFWFPVLMAALSGLFFSWFYSLGTYLHKKLPYDTRMHLTRFKIFLFVPAAYIIGICLLMAGAMQDGWQATGLEMAIPALLVPVHLFAMFCIFYCMYFIAKAMKTVETGKAGTFSDFAGEFFLIWFFPVGVWILQPRINAIFAEDEVYGDVL